MQHVHAARARALPTRGLSPQIAMQESAEMLRRDSGAKRRKTVHASTAYQFPASRALLHLLQIQRNAHAVHEHHALINQLLISNISIYKLT